MPHSGGPLPLACPRGLLGAMLGLLSTLRWTRRLTMHSDWERYDRDVPYGYCHCGCGGKPPVARRNDTIHGLVRGEPKRYIHGHNRRVMPYPRGRTCKITREQADEIERRELAGERQVALSDEFGISQGQISRIARKKAWKEAALDTPQEADHAP